MVDELNGAIRNYQLQWETLATKRRDRGFFENLRPTAIGWKTAEPGDFDKRFAALRAYSDQIHLGWVNERWIATFHLREPLLWGITIVKLMQLRPGSTDRIGLDHVDFLAPDGVSAAILKSSEADLNVTDEKNGEHCRWVSIWFAETEAKLRADTTLDICAAEMKETSEALLAALSKPASSQPVPGQ
jgi:hypothetical protein